MADPTLETSPRRATLFGAAALAAVAGAASEAPATDTHILRLFREFLANRAAARAYVYTGDPKNEDDVMETLFFSRSDRIEGEMMALPSTCAADVAAKMLVAHRDGEMSCLHLDDPVWVEARELTGGLA